MACPRILAPPAGSPHAHLPFKISLSSVLFGLQLSLVESQVQGDPRRRHCCHQCHQCVGVAVHAEIRHLVHLTSSSGDRFDLHYVSRMVCDMVWSISIYNQDGTHIELWSPPVSQALMCMIYPFFNLLPPFQYAYTVFPAFVLHRHVSSSE